MTSTRPLGRGRTSALAGRRASGSFTGRGSIQSVRCSSAWSTSERTETISVISASVAGLPRSVPSAATNRSACSVSIRFRPLSWRTRTARGWAARERAAARSRSTAARGSSGRGPAGAIGRASVGNGSRTGSSAGESVVRPGGCVLMPATLPSGPVRRQGGAPSSSLGRWCRPDGRHGVFVRETAHAPRHFPNESGATRRRFPNESGRGEGRWGGGQPMTASTSRCASACTCVRCSGPRKDSA